jgi:hypothetical protein
MGSSSVLLGYSIFSFMCMFCSSFFFCCFVLFLYGHCVVCPSIYGLWLPLWYLQTLLVFLTFFFWILHFLSIFDLGFWLPFSGIFKLYVQYSGNYYQCFNLYNNHYTFCYLLNVLRYAFVLFLLTIVFSVLLQYRNCL